MNRFIKVNNQYINPAHITQVEDLNDKVLSRMLGPEDAYIPYAIITLFNGRMEEITADEDYRGLINWLNANSDDVRETPSQKASLKVGSVVTFYDMRKGKVTTVDHSKEYPYKVTMDDGSGEAWVSAFASGFKNEPKPRTEDQFNEWSIRVRVELKDMYGIDVSEVDHTTIRRCWDDGIDSPIDAARIIAWNRGEILRKPNRSREYTSEVYGHLNRLYVKPQNISIIRQIYAEKNEGYTPLEAAHNIASKMNWQLKSE